MLAYLIVSTMFVFIMATITLRSFWKSDNSYWFSKFIQAPQLGCFFLCALIIFIRDPQALLRAEFWAEDMSEFFVAAKQYGAHSIGQTVYGYFFLIQRIIAYTSSGLPTFISPFIYAFCSFLINVFVSSYFSRASFSKFIPDLNVRILLCLVFALTGGTPEVHYNLSNSPSHLTLFIGLVVLEQQSVLKLWQVLALIPIVLSAGSSILLLPLIAYSAWNTKNRNYVLLFLIILTVAFANTYFTTHSEKAQKLLNWGMLLRAPQAYLENFLNRLFVLPFFGAGLSSYIMRNYLIFYSVVIAFLVFLKLRIFKGTLFANDSVRLIFIFYFGIILMFPLVAVARSYGTDNHIFIKFGVPLWKSRYSFLPAFSSLLLWTSCLFPLFNDKDIFKARASKIIFLIMVINSVITWPDIYKRTDLHWNEGAAAIDKFSTNSDPNASLDLKKWVHPKGWTPADGSKKIDLINRIE